MGIKSLNKFLRNNAPQIYETIHLSEYAFKKIAIDISLYLCKYKAIYGSDWLFAFIRLVTCLRKNEIHCIFIYDSGAPPEKQDERNDRAFQREKNDEKIYELEEALNKYHTTGEIDQVLIDVHNKAQKTMPQRLLRRSIIEEKINIHIIETKLEKMKSNIISITQQDFELTRQLFNILDVPVLNAPLEAETAASDLCKRGLVDAVLSEDTDVIAYGAPVFLSKIDVSNNTCIRVSIENVTNSLELDYDQLLDLCIMCGTDYNKNIFKIGPEKAYRLIKEHKSIENIRDNANIDVSVLKHIRVRELFKNYEQFQINYINYCGIPNFNALQEFIFVNNVKFDIEGLRKSFVRDIVIIDD